MQKLDKIEELNRSISCLEKQKALLDDIIYRNNLPTVVANILLIVAYLGAVYYDCNKNYIILLAIMVFGFNVGDIVTFLILEHKLNKINSKLINEKFERNRIKILGYHEQDTK